MTSRISIVLVAFTGCALLSNPSPQQLRYFTPTSTLTPASSTTSSSAAPIAQLRLGPVTASNYLRYPIEHRASAVEVAPYQTLRWTELPEAYVQRSLASALFEARPLEQAVDATGPELDIEVLGFEEVERAGQRVGRVQFAYKLIDAHGILASGLVTVERDAAHPTISAVVIAIGQAMDAASSELADRVIVMLRAATSIRAPS